jgi:uncharacterized protein YkwD
MVAALLFGCGPAASSSRMIPVDAPARSSPGDAALESEVLDLVNRHRVGLGLRPLALDARVGRAAHEHSAAMASGRVRLGHDEFPARIAATGRVCQRSAENVAFNEGHARPGAEAVDGWLKSRAHRRAIEGPYDVTGVGVASNAAGAIYFTQIFLGACAP